MALRKLKQAERLYERGVFLKANSKFYQSEKIFREASAIFKDHKNFEKYCSALNELGTVLIHLGKFSEALKYLKIALQVSVRIKNRKLYADVVGNMGIVKFYWEFYDESKKLYEKELRINVRRKDEYRIQLALGKIGNVYFKVNNLKKAIEYFERQMNICIKIGNDRFLTYALGGLGACYLEKRDYEKCFYYFGMQIPVCEKIKELRALSLALCSIGIVHYIKQDYDLALIYYKRALHINVKLKNYRDLIFIYGHLGSLHQQKKEFGKAVFYFMKQYDLSGKLKMFRQKAIAIGELGNIFKEKKDLKSSLLYFRKQLSICRKHKLLTGLYFALENTGEIYRQIKKYSLSLKYFTEQLALSKKIFGAKHFNTSRALRNNGNAYLELCKFKKALSYYQKSLTALSKKFNSVSIEDNPGVDDVFSEDELYETLKSKAVALKKFYEHDKNSLKYLELSLGTYEAALSVIDKMRLSFKEQSSKYFLSENLIPVYEQAIDTAYELSDITGEESYIEQAFCLAEKNKAAALLENMRESEAKIISGLPQNLHDRENFYKTEISLNENLKYNEFQKGIKARKKIINGLDEKIFNLKQEYNSFIERLEKKFPQYYKLKYEMPKTSVREIRDKLIDEKTVFLEYFAGEKYIFIFNITCIHFKVIRILKTKNFEKYILGIRENITGTSFLNHSSGFKKFTELAYKLYQMLIYPCRDELENKTHLIIIPDNLMSLIPIEALISEAPAENREYKNLCYLVKNYSVSYSYSSIFLLKNVLAPQKTGKPNILGFAPGFEEKNNIKSKNSEVNYRSGLDPLNFNEEELKEIKKYFTGEYFIKAGATKRTFLEKAAGYSILHLATHCIIDDKNPMCSRICFSQSKDPENENESSLYNYELFNLKLNSRLAVLSACHTGFGKLIKGEGILSIARGFAYSNCNSIVMSLWQVNDQSTSAIMGNFYKNLSGGEKIDDSLRLAKLIYLENADEFHSSPFFWAPFIIAGNTDSFVKLK